MHNLYYGAIDTDVRGEHVCRSRSENSEHWTIRRTVTNTGASRLSLSHSYPALIEGRGGAGCCGCRMEVVSPFRWIRCLQMDGMDSGMTVGRRWTY